MRLIRYPPDPVFNDPWEGLSSEPADELDGVGDLVLDDRVVGCRRANSNIRAPLVIRGVISLWCSRVPPFVAAMPYVFRSGPYVWADPANDTPPRLDALVPVVAVTERPDLSRVFFVVLERLVRE